MKLTQKLIKQILQKEDPLVLEIGAHTGEDTKKFLEEFKDIKIYCFEPDPRCIKKFKRYIKDNRCILVEAAVYSNDGKTILNMSSGWPTDAIPYFIRFLRLEKYYLSLMKKEWDYSSSIKIAMSNPKDYPWLIFDKKIEVTTLKLDSWIKKNNIESIDFIWADMQGAEKDMIEGANSALKSSKYFYTEYGESSSYVGALTRDETIELLQKHNYEVIQEYSSEKRMGELLFRNKLTGRKD